MAAETILIVDDEPVVLSTATNILKHSGFNTLQAASANEALTICREKQQLIHVALVDVALPQVLALELRRCLKEIFPGIRVLFISAVNFEEIARQGIAAEPEDFLQKPFSATDLVGKVKAALTRP